MNIFSNITAGLVLGLVVTSALPGFAATRVVSPGLNALAQAIPQEIGGLAEHTWGHHRRSVYSACMAERGEVE